MIIKNVEIHEGVSVRCRLLPIDRHEWRRGEYEYHCGKCQKNVKIQTTSGGFIDNEAARKILDAFQWQKTGISWRCDVCSNIKSAVINCRVDRIKLPETYSRAFYALGGKEPKPARIGFFMKKGAHMARITVVPKPTPLSPPPTDT